MHGLGQGTTAVLANTLRVPHTLGRATFTPPPWVQTLVVRASRRRPMHETYLLGAVQRPRILTVGLLPAQHPQQQLRHAPPESVDQLLGPGTSCREQFSRAGSS